VNKKRLFWLLANLVMLAVIVAIAWATLLPAIWGPSDGAQSEFGDRRVGNTKGK